MRELFVQKFQIPDVARDYLNVFFDEQEMDFVETISKEVFTKEDISKIISSDADEFIKSSYRRGLISLVDEEGETYRVNDFYGKLDIFAISETERYRTLPRQVRREIDNWYFDAFYNSLDPNPDVRPTPDEILTLDEVLDFIDQQGDRPVYLNYCDCRSLSGDCGFPTKTCITYKNGINTFMHRGLSEKIDKDRAKEVVTWADRKGLMHTVNPNGICNCCTDCCYLFRGQERRDSSGFWPASNHIVGIDQSTCIACGKCVRRCHFGVFQKVEDKIVMNTDTCVGCGICATGCPTKALTMKGR